MSFYTAGLKTHLVDAVHDNSNFRTEFRLHPDTVYLANFRIANLGCHVDTKGKYNALTGTQGVIKSIHLYDGNQLLDQILQFPLWSAFTSYNTSNQRNMDMQKVLNRTDLGFTFADRDDPVANGSTLDPAARISPRFAPEQADTTSDATAKGWLSLKGMLPLLDASLYMPTGVFKNLRLVLQYETDAAKIVQRATTSTTEEPLLIVDEILDPNKQKSINSGYKGLTFMSIEHDRLYLEALTASDAVKSVTSTVSGFDNKTINRILIINTPVTASGNNSHNGGFNSNYMDRGSVAQLNQKIQLRVNGENRFARDGITRPNERLAKLTDVWGTCNSIPGSNQTNLASSSIGSTTKNLVAKVNTPTAGELSLVAAAASAIGGRFVTITADADESGNDFTVEGTDMNGNSATIPMKGPNATSVTGTIRFDKVDKITIKNNGTGNVTVDLTADKPVVSSPSLLGNLDYFGCNVGTVVQELQIDFQRQGVAKGNNAVYIQALQLNLFAEAIKQIKVHGAGKYNVMYV